MCFVEQTWDKQIGMSNIWHRKREDFPFQKILSQDADLKNIWKALLFGQPFLDL